MRQGLTLFILLELYRSKKMAARFQWECNESRWYFICLSHIYHFIRRSEISLYVNGEHISTQPLNFPKLDKVLYLFIF